MPTQLSARTEQPARIPWWRRISIVLVATLLLMVIGTAGVLQALNVRILRQQASAQVQAQLESVVQLKEQQIQRWLDDSQNVLRDLVINPFVPQFRELAARPDEPGLSVAANRVLASLTEPAPNGELRYRRVWFYLPDGRVIAASDPRDISKVVRTQAYFGASLE